MAEAQLSEEQYREQGAIVCPICEDTRSVYPTTQRESWASGGIRPAITVIADYETSDLLALPMECKECGATWHDSFQLIGYGNLKLRGVEVTIPEGE